AADERQRGSGASYLHEAAAIEVDHASFSCCILLCWSWLGGWNERLAQARWGIAARRLADRDDRQHHHGRKIGKRCPHLGRQDRRPGCARRLGVKFKRPEQAEEIGPPQQPVRTTAAS